MPRIDLIRESAVSRSGRARQLEGIFDLPPSERSKLEWHGDLAIEDRDWKIGLIVGPSGAGKSTILQSVFGRPLSFDWKGESIIDDFDESLSIEDIAAVCQAVGFNTIPAWLRPYSVLSNGERFRADIARALLEGDEMLVLDEFTSVVDRQIAQIGSYAVSKYVRKSEKRFVAASCHYDIVEWLDPDWIFEPHAMRLTWRLLRRPRPEIPITISRVPYSAWRMFAPFHYLTSEMHKAARCFVLFANDQPAAFAGLLYRPHPRKSNQMGVSRLVTLPDWQGLGLAFVLADAVAGAYQARGFDVNTYPAHPALIRAFDRSPRWSLRGKPGTIIPTGRNSVFRTKQKKSWAMGERPNATFRYVGKPLPIEDADRLLCDSFGK